MYFHWGTFLFFPFLNSKFINCSKFLVLGEIQSDSEVFRSIHNISRHHLVFIDI